MKPVLAQTLKHRWFVTGVHLALWFLLYLAVSGLGGKAPLFGDSSGTSAPSRSPVPVKRLHGLFAPEAWPRSVVDTNALSLVFTRHFIPPAMPAPPPPTTRKIELTYQGFFQTADGPKTAIVKLGDLFLISPVGTKVTANLFAADATMQSLLLTNAAAQTNLLLLNTKKEIEVPIP